MISWLREIGRNIAYHYPFSPSGTLLALVSIYLLGFGYSVRNFTVLFLAVLAITLLVLLWVVGKIQALRFAREDHIWSIPSYVFARRSDGKVRVDTGPGKCLLFYRIHVSLRINEKVGGNARLRMYREGSFYGPGAVSVPLVFPLAGEAVLRGSLKIVDVLGLTRNRFGDLHENRVSAVPSLISDAGVQLNPEGGLDTRSRQKSADEEKYYMRDYIPGDKLRDINWKASTRSADIFTRISPVSQEQTKTLYIDFRHFWNGSASPKNTLEQVYHLDFMKSWLLTFLWNVKRDNKEYRFDVLTGRGRAVLEEEEDIIKLGYQLGSLFFQADPGDLHGRDETEEVYIFSSPFDSSLNRALTAYTGFHVHLFQTAFPGREHGTVREIPLFDPGQLFLPGWWALLRETRAFKNNFIPRVPGAAAHSRTERLSLRMVLP